VTGKLLLFAAVCSYWHGL